jgi:hypothetical protein
MKNRAMFGFVVGLCIVAATAIFAQTNTPPTDMNQNADTNGTTSVTGKVVSTSGSTLVIDTDSGNRMTFDTSGTAVPASASVGTRVQVAYSPTTTGNGNRLSTVTVLPATGTATADTRYGSTGSMGTSDTTGSTNSMNTNRTGSTNQDSDMYASNRNLPKTASLMPLAAVLGIVAFGAALGLRIVRSSF